MSRQGPSSPIPDPTSTQVKVTQIDSRQIQLIKRYLYRSAASTVVMVFAFVVAVFSTMKNKSYFQMASPMTVFLAALGVLALAVTIYGFAQLLKLNASR